LAADDFLKIDRFPLILVDSPEKSTENPGGKTRSAVADFFFTGNFVNPAWVVGAIMYN
jgi:hypothetical protein